MGVQRVVGSVTVATFQRASLDQAPRPEPCVRTVPVSLGWVGISALRTVIARKPDRVPPVRVATNLPSRASAGRGLSDARVEHLGPGHRSEMAGYLGVASALRPFHPLRPFPNRCGSQV